MYAGREVLGYGQEEELWVVLEEDGTEVSPLPFGKPGPTLYYSRPKHRRTRRKGVILTIYPGG